MIQDIRLGLRHLIKRPGWALAIILVLAIGIGANTAMFSGFEAWVLRPLDFEGPERLVSLNESQPELGRHRVSVSHRNLGDWIERQRSFVGIGWFQTLQMNLNDEAEPARLDGTRISASLFPLLGKKPFLGRNFNEAEDLPGAASPVVLISHRLWRERFGGDPDVVGRTLRLDGTVREILGVMEPHFAFPAWSDVWIPMGLDVRAGPRGLHWLSVVARLGDGVSVQAASAELSSIAGELAEEYPDTNRGYSANAISLREDFVPPVIEVALAASLSSAIFVLLVICANVASLMLARASARSRETAVRAALGASRLSLARQNIVEGLLLAIPAGLLGAGIGVLGVRSTLAYVPVDPPYLFRMGFSGKAGVYTLIVSIAAGAASGLAPVLRNSGVRLHDALKSGGREAGGREATRFRSALVVGELALSTALLIGALLMVKSFVTLQAVQPGFRTRGVLTAQLSLRGAGGDEAAAWVRSAERLTGRLASQPGVDAVGMSSHTPAGQGYRVWGLEAKDHPRPPGEPGEDVHASVYATLGDYFGALAIPVIAGRDFTEVEKRGGGDVAIVSAGLAASLWGRADPLGRLVRATSFDNAPWLRVVGVVGDVDVGRDMVNVGDVPDVQLYVPYGRSPTSQLHVVVHGVRPAADLAAAMRASFRSALPGVPFSEILTMNDAIFRVRWVSRFFSRQLVIYAVLAILVAAVGIYGLTADSVSRRRRELAIRTALGAKRSSLVRLILRETIVLGGVGVGLGLVVASVMTGLASSMFAGVGARDPVVFTAVGFAVLLVIVVAAVVPARQASALDPISALRME